MYALFNIVLIHLKCKHTVWKAKRLYSTVDVQSLRLSSVVSSACAMRLLLGNRCWTKAWCWQKRAAHSFCPELRDRLCQTRWRMAVFRLSTSVFWRKHYFSHKKYKGGFNIWWFGIYPVHDHSETTEIN